MQQNEYNEDVQVSDMPDSGEKKEKKEQLRSKVQALVSYYEEEKRRNEELEMEIERLKAEQQRQAPPPYPQQAPGYGMEQFPPQPGGFPALPQQQPRPGFPPPAAPPPSFGGPPPQYPQQPGGFPPPPPAAPPPPPAPPPQSYTLQNFGQQQQQYGQQPQQRPPAPQPMPYAAPPPQQQPYGQQPPAGGNMIGQVLQTIEQVRAKLHYQADSIRGAGYQQPSYVDYDTVNLLDKLYDQLGDLSRELQQRRY